MAILLRSPEEYRANLEEAFNRAGISVHFARGVRRPDPAGRASFALLKCAAEGLSARRFAEYLSLGQVHDAAAEGAPPAAAPRGDQWVEPDTETVTEEEPAEDLERRQAECVPAANGEEAPVREGQLRVPQRWEQLLVAAAANGMTRQTLRDWVHRFNADGVTGLRSRTSPGRPPALNETRREELKSIVLTWRLSRTARGREPMGAQIYSNVPFCPNPGFILEPDLDRLTRRRSGQCFLHQASEVFFKSHFGLWVLLRVVGPRLQPGHSKLAQPFAHGLLAHRHRPSRGDLFAKVNTPPTHHSVPLWIRPLAPPLARLLPRAISQAHDCEPESCVE